MPAALRYLLVVVLLVAVAVGGYLLLNREPEPRPEVARPSRVVDGLDMDTGLIAEGDYLLVKGNCLACHSAKLVTQNRATREGWLEMIHWMQEKQGLWDLGAQEGPILDYLATYYAPEESGRRPPLGEVEWYRLDTND